MLAHRVISSGRSGFRPYNEEVLSDTPVIWWRLDETSGTTASDSSGNGNSGTYGSGVTLNQAPLISSGKSILASAASQKAVSGTNIAFSTAVAAELWIKLISAPSANRLIAGKVLSGSFPVWAFRIGADGKPSAELFNQNGTAGRMQLFAPSSIADNVKHQVAFSWDKNGDQKLHLYVDGVQVAESAAWNNTLWAGSGHAVTLYESGSETIGFDEVSIYSHSLSADRIQSHYNSALA